jgi:hypothetical protein
MSDTGMESFDSLQASEEKFSHFTQAGSPGDPSLGALRDQIKKVMIPLLIKTFQFKLELGQHFSPPSRLQSQKNQRSPEEIIEQLKTLDHDLKVLHLWCQSCRSQIQKALSVPEEEQKGTVAVSSSSTHPAVAKSFQEAVSAQTSFFQQQPTQDKEKTSPETPPRKKWWGRLMGNQPDADP